MEKDLRVYVTGVAVGLGVSLSVFLLIILWLGPLLLPREFITDTGPNFVSLLALVPAGIAFVAGFIFAIKEEKRNTNVPGGG